MKLISTLILLIFLSPVHAGLQEALDAQSKGDYKTAIFNLKQEIEKEQNEYLKNMLHEYLGIFYYHAPDDIDSDYQLAFKHLNIASNNEYSSNVEFVLGFMHYAGRGVEKNYLKAKEHFEHALKYEEEKRALWVLGKLYLHGLGVEKDYQKANDYFQRAHEVNYANAQFELGHMHEYGKGFPVSIPRAIYYYEKAAEQGDADAQYKIDLHTGKINQEQRDIDFETALDYTYGFTQEIDFDKAFDYYQKSAENGSSVAVYNIGFITGHDAQIKNRKEQMQYYKKAAEMGNHYAQSSLSDSYYLGVGVDIDKAKSLYWEIQAAEGGNIESINSVANKYYNGDGTGKNFEKALEWYQIGADQGDGESIYHIAQMYENGEGVEKDAEKAIELYLEAANKNYGEAQNKLAEYYFKGILVDRDYQKSFDWAKKASDLGVAEAKSKLGVFYMMGKDVVEIDAEKAFKYLNEAADLGSVKAYGNLGRFYYNGIGIKKDYSKAFHWYKKGAEMGNADAQYNLGQFYDFGYAVEKDVNEAIKWYEKAAEQDLKKAQIALGSVYYFGDEDANIIKNYKKSANYYYTAANNDSDINNKNIEFKTTSSGSGFFVTPTHILTNDHVTSACDEIFIKNKNYESKVSLLDTDANTDLSILKTGKPSKTFLYFRNRKPITTGEQSIALGYPLSSTLGSDLKVTTGNISALTGFDNNIAELQLTSPVQPGNSGGPLLDDNGNVIGVIVSRLESSGEITGDRLAQNVNFAIKSNMAKIFLDLNVVDYQVRKSNGARAVSTIVNEARDATVQVICKEKE